MTIRPENRAISSRQLMSLPYFWSLLRAPETFSLSLLVLAGILSVAAIIPQQPAQITGDDELAAWIGTLPPLYGSLAPFLNVVGGFRIFETAWFWLPVAWLVLVSLIVLADYTPHLQGRFWGKNGPAMSFQPHPFHRRLVKTIQVPAPAEAGKSAASSTPLAYLQTNLEKAAYRTHPLDGQQRYLALRFPRRWGGPVFVISGILLILVGLVVQALWGARQAFDISAKSIAPALLANQPISIQRFTPRRDSFEQLVGGSVILDIGPAKDLDWQFHRPYRFEDWWVVLAGVQPVAEIALTQNGSPPETIALTFPSAVKPAYFISSEGDLLFELRYVATDRGPTYELKLARGSNGPDEIIQNGSAFTIPDFNMAGNISMDEKLRLRAYQLPGLGPGLGGAILALIGLIMLSSPPPSVIRLTMITKGRGSRIEVEAEVLRTLPPQPDIFNQTLDLPPSENIDD